MTQIVDLYFTTPRRPAIKPVQAEISKMMQDSKLLFGPEAERVIAEDDATHGDDDDAVD